MKLFWTSLSRGKQIAISVLFAHFFLIVVLVIHHFATSRFTPKRAIAIRTVSPIARQFSAPPIAQQKSKPTVQKPTVQRSAAQKKRASSAKPSSVKKPAVDSSLFEELNQSLEALSSLSSVPVSSVPLSIPQSIEKKQSLAVVEQSSDISYAESLICYLQSALELPELGEVRAQLVVGANGELQRCEILEAKSDRNADFLKNRLPELPFPCFNDADAKTFTVVFRNVENR